MLTGFKHDDARIGLKVLLDQVKKVSYPSEWEDTINLISGKTHYLEIDVKPGSTEWIRIEKNLKETVPSA